MSDVQKYFFKSNIYYLHASVTGHLSCWALGSRLSCPNGEAALPKVRSQRMTVSKIARRGLLKWYVAFNIKEMKKAYSCFNKW